MYTVAFMFALLLMGLMRVRTLTNTLAPISEWHSCCLSTSRLTRTYAVHVRAGGVHAMHMLRRPLHTARQSRQCRVSLRNPPCHPPHPLDPFRT
jgi:hypothetical protein